MPGRVVMQILKNVLNEEKEEDDHAVHMHALFSSVFLHIYEYKTCACIHMYIQTNRRKYRQEKLCNKREFHVNEKSFAISKHSFM